jgi:hypothetical protein
MAENKTAVEVVKKLDNKQKAVLLYGKDAWWTNAIPGTPIVPIEMHDGPCGLRKPKGGKAEPGEMVEPSYPATCFPPPCLTACSWDPSLLSSVGGPEHREVRRRHLVPRRQVQPDLEQLQRVGLRGVEQREHLGVHDAAARRSATARRHRRSARWRPASPSGRSGPGARWSRSRSRGAGAREARAPACRGTCASRPCRRSPAPGLRPASEASGPSCRCRAGRRRRGRRKTGRGRSSATGSPGAGAGARFEVVGALRLQPQRQRRHEAAGGQVVAHEGELRDHHAEPVGRGLVGERGVVELQAAVAVDAVRAGGGQPVRPVQRAVERAQQHVACQVGRLLQRPAGFEQPGRAHRQQRLAEQPAVAGHVHRFGFGVDRKVDVFAFEVGALVRGGDLHVSPPSKNREDEDVG